MMPALQLIKSEDDIVIVDTRVGFVEFQLRRWFATTYNPTDLRETLGSDSLT